MEELGCSVSDIHCSIVCDLYTFPPSVSSSSLADSRKDKPPKSKSNTRSSSVTVTICVSFAATPFGCGIGPSMVSRTSSGSGPSGMVVDCLSVEPFGRFCEARKELVDSFETSESDEALGVKPGLGVGACDGACAGG